MMSQDAKFALGFTNGVAMRSPRLAAAALQPRLQPGQCAR
jgi:hypothetical protein